MTEFRRPWLLLATALAAMANGGCGGGNRIVPISGTITWQGKPLASGRVVFHPQQVAEGAVRRPATGDLDEAGRYQLTTLTKGDGAAPGNYRVCVFSYLSDQTSAANDVEIPETVWRIPERYGNPETSGLTAEIPPGSRPLQFNFDVTESR